ncbi:MAG: CBS domain-containing protein [Chloroflexaceae bacterium]|nr:CBS domain-containing protein [Chloroflexaceae bacterium]
MPGDEQIQRVRIYISESDTWEQRPLYQVVMQRLQREGATGVTVLQGIAGFGPGQGSQGVQTLATSEHRPLVIEWVDRSDRIKLLLPLLDDLLPNALITLEEVTPYRAMMRSQGPFASDHRVGDSMSAPPQTVHPIVRLNIALMTMIKQRQSIWPVLNEQGYVLGQVTEEQLMARIGLRLPFHLLEHLSERELQAIVEPFISLQVADVMSNESRSVYQGSAIAQALVMMIEWGYEQLPVIDRNQKMVGLLRYDDVLRAALNQAGSDDSTVRDAEPPLPVRLIMQTAVPQITLNQTLAHAIQYVQQGSHNYLVVLDEERQVHGILSDVAILAHLDHHERARFLSFMQKPADTDPATLPGTDRGFLDIIKRDIITVRPTDTVLHVTRQLLDANTNCIIVLDDEAKLAGQITRGGLMRALLQAIR